MDRVFHLKKEGQPGALPAIQTLLQTPNTMVVAFTVDPGQEVPQHIHPASDDIGILFEMCTMIAKSGRRSDAGFK